MFRADEFLEHIRDKTQEGYDDIEMVRICNEEIMRINSYQISGLQFKPLPRICNMEQLREHKMSCLLCQNDREISSVLIPAIIANIKLQEEDTNAYYLYKNEFDTMLQNYISHFSMLDMTGNTNIMNAYDVAENLDGHICTCNVAPAHPMDHFHQIRNGVVTNDKFLIHTMAKGQYKDHSVGNNDRSAILHRNGGELNGVNVGKNNSYLDFGVRKVLSDY